MRLGCRRGALLLAAALAAGAVSNAPAALRAQPEEPVPQDAAREVPTLRARLDPGLGATLGDLTPLRYDDGGAAAEDRPGHVRGASALCRSGKRLAIVQDDVHVLALRDARGSVAPLLLPADANGHRSFDDGRGNKHAKMDLEACAQLPDGRLLALGSGSTPARERLVVVDAAGKARVVAAPALYAGLRAARAFAGSELNVEGAVAVDDALRLFQRGNGAPRGGLLPVDATADLPLGDFLRWLDGAGPPPRPERIVQFDLGGTAGVRYGFTDAALLADGRIGFLACAEDSPDAVRDGEVLGCRFGILDGTSVRTSDVVDPAGRRLPLKLEGMAPRPEDAASLDVVVDMDDPDLPARLGRLRISGG